MVRLMKLKRMMRMMIPPSTISSPTSIASNLHGLLSYVIWFLFISHIFVPLEFVSSLFVLCWYLFLLYLFSIFRFQSSIKSSKLFQILSGLYFCASVQVAGLLEFFDTRFFCMLSLSLFLSRQFELQKSFIYESYILHMQRPFVCRILFSIYFSVFRFVFVFSVWRLQMSIGWQIEQGWTLTTTADKFKVFLLPTLGWVGSSLLL